MKVAMTVLVLLGLAAVSYGAVTKCVVCTNCASDYKTVSTCTAGVTYGYCQKTVVAGVVAKGCAVTCAEAKTDSKNLNKCCTGDGCNSAGFVKISSGLMASLLAAALFFTTRA